MKIEVFEQLKEQIKLSINYLEKEYNVNLNSYKKDIILNFISRYKKAENLLETKSAESLKWHNFSIDGGSREYYENTHETNKEFLDEMYKSEKMLKLFFEKN